MTIIETLEWLASDARDAANDAQEAHLVQNADEVEAARNTVHDILAALRACVGAIQSLTGQVEQMRGMFTDDDGAIADAIQDGEEAEELAADAIAKAEGH